LSGAFPSDRIPQATKFVSVKKFPHNSIPISYTSEFREVFEATMYCIFCVVQTVSCIIYEIDSYQ
jgi:hypothetical protein